MSLADRLITKAGKLLTKFNVTDTLVYKRVITRTGGDPLIGKPATVTKVDTLLNPPPIVESITLTLRTEKGGFFPGAVIAGAVIMVGDLIFTVSSQAVTAQELANKDFCFVYGTEERYAVAVQPIMLQGKDIIFLVLARRKG